MDSNNNIDLIERYLNNEMSSEEKQALDQQISTDKELAAEFERRQTAHKAIDFLIAQNLKTQLETMENEQGQDNVISLRKRRRNRIVLLSLAASLLLLVGFFTIYFPQSASTGPELAFANYETPDYNINRSDNTPNFEDVITRGLNALKQQEYQTAIITLDSVATSHEFYIIAQFYLAHAYYQSEQYQQAEQTFEMVSASNDIRYKEEADWYGLLACLAQEGNCTGKINTLANDSNHSYQQQTIAIRKQLK